MTTARYALGFVVSVATLGTLGACGGRYELGEDEASGGKVGTGGTGGTMTGGTGGSGGKSGGSGGKATTGGTGGGGTGGTEISTGGTGGDGVGGTGDVGGTGNAGGEGRFVSQIRTRPYDKLDLLLMVDNSLGMADKQRLLAEAIPYLLRRITTPDCVDENGTKLGTTANELGECAEGVPELAPMRDVHVGVITSSVGDHGSGDICSPATDDGTRNYDDGAQLLPSVRSGLTDYQGQGFLAWDPSEHLDPPGTSDQNELAVGISDQVLAAGDRGCGFEASLEAWYRFLVDPEPVATMANDQLVAVRGPVSQTVLAQRAAFLRPDSQLAIIMLSDENDCSILDEDGTQGWLVPFKGGPMSNSWRMPRATSACADPNSPDCVPCTSNGADDPACLAGASLSLVEDPPNLRCHAQKKRFGIDLLYPIERYIEALSNPTVTPRLNGNPVPNPLFVSNGNFVRDPASIVLMGILGVPWQDLATEDSLNGGPLTYMSSSELSDQGRWDVIGSEGILPPKDPFMIESVDPRPAGTPHPVLGDDAAVLGTGTAGVLNPINGHEHRVGPDRSDLQYACIYPLATPQECADQDPWCDCPSDQAGENDPLCDFETTPGTGIQQYGKAYPSNRQLDLMWHVRVSAVPTSACAPNTDPSSADAPDYGYKPNMDALVRHMKDTWGPLCLPRSLPVDSDDRITCRILEVGSDACDCSAPGRSPATSADTTAMRDLLQGQLGCGENAPYPCESLCGCELAQLEGAELAACQGDVADSGSSHGYCYVDPAAGAGSDQIVAGCPADMKRMVRFLGEGVPAEDKPTVIVCDPE